MKKILLILSLAILLVIPAGTFAQSSEKIDSFQTTISLDTDGTALVQETIVYDFGSNARRGIYRDLPVRYFIDDSSGFEIDVDLISVTRDGQPEPFTLNSNDADFLNIRVGVEDTTYTGQHTYVFTYTTSSIVVDAVDGTQILRWDSPGVKWAVPVSSVGIILYTTTYPVDLTCYSGVFGSTEANCSATGVTVSSLTQLSAGDNVTAEYVFPANSFSSTAVVKPLSSTDGAVAGWILFAIFGLVMLLPLSVFVYMFWRHFHYKRRRKQETVYPRYEPPADMTPAEMGLLIDNSSDGTELSATLIDLAVRGYLKIKQTKEKKWYRSAVYSFVATDKSPADLSGYEKSIYDALFDERTEVDSNDLAKDTGFQKVNLEFHKELKKNLESKGFYKKVSIFTINPSARMNDAGYGKWAEIEGFRDFLAMTEKDRLAFTDAPERKPEQFSALLPYAVALGVEKEWTGQFANLTVNVDEWYQGRAGSNLLFASSISNMTTGLNSIAHTANSSSGFSGGGGGFSGGGFGGGGGGSW